LSRRASITEDFEGYRPGDNTYCVDPETNQFFPVRIVTIGRRFLHAESLDDELTDAAAPEFAREPKNRQFVRPPVTNLARFGGCDERTVNAERVSGQELRLLPSHYSTQVNKIIRERNAKAPERWPLPSGTVYERWFKNAGGEVERTNG
jgi:hypothetical protein